MKLLGNCVQFYAKSFTGMFIFRTWRELINQTELVVFMSICKCSTFLVNFRANTFRVHVGVFTKFELQTKVLRTTNKSRFNVVSYFHSNV